MKKIFRIMARASVCRVCGKRVYFKKQIARQAANAMEKMHKVPFDAYYSKKCGAWHIGRIDKKKSKKLKKRWTQDIDMEKIAVLGIDPGKKGAVALLGSSFLQIWDFRNIEDAEELISSLNRLFDIKFSILEKVEFRPGDAGHIKSVEKLVRNAEMWHTLLHIHHIHHEEYAPATWRKGLIPRGHQKNKSVYIEKAIKVFSDFPSDLFFRHDRAEAALMAHRAWKHVNAGWPTEKVQ